jgi:ADP-ribosyl-[dinitrogen reductase] hydrolase
MSRRGKPASTGAKGRAIGSDSDAKGTRAKGPLRPASARRRVVDRPSLSYFKGCLLGGALGDALGYPIEFISSSEEIARRYGVAPPRDLDFSASGALISDDTQMTLFTAEGLIRGMYRWMDKGHCHLASCMQRAYLRWYATQGAQRRSDSEEDMVYSGWLIGEQRLWHRRGPGNTCLSALARTLERGGLPTVEAPPNDSKGCGAVMRSAPFGLAARDRDWAFCEARDAAVLTHGHPSGFLAAAYFAALIHDTSRGVALDEAMLEADKLLAREKGHEEVVATVAKVRALVPAGPPTYQSLESIGGGWVAEETLGIALLCSLTAGAGSPTTVRQALWRSVAHGGDSDSTGSLTGNLLGAMFGLRCLPRSWLNELELRDLVERIATDMHRVFGRAEAGSCKGYPPN